MKEMALIQVDRLSFRYPGIEVLRNLSFEVRTGSFLALVGPNGAGKSSLLNLICGGLRPSDGSILVDSCSVESYRPSAMARKVSLVRQQSVPAFDFSVAETIMTGRIPHLEGRSFEGPADKEAAGRAMEATDTARLRDRPLSGLSSGERQRVFIARALAQDSPILLLDEPTSFLDLKHQVEIYDLLKTEQQSEGKTILIVTHDINLAAQYCDAMLLLGGPERHHLGSPRAILSSELVQQVFDVRGFVGQVDREKFFLPLGRLASDAGLLSRQ